MVRLFSTIAILLLASAATAQTSVPTTRPDRDVVVSDRPTEADLDRLARMRRYPDAMRRLRHDHFGRIRSPRLRAEGLAELTQYTDPAAFRPMWREMREETDEVRLAVLDHLLDQGDDGQAALAWIAIREGETTDVELENQYEATRRLTGPASPPVIDVINAALQSPDDRVANAAASIAGTLDVLEVIPQLIMNQNFVPSVSGDEGDLGWIAVGKQTVYIAELVPIVGNNAVAFQPIPGVLTEGFVFRVHDAVVIIHRTIIHRVLVRMTTDDWGETTDHLGYDSRAWAEWYNNEYVPHKNEELRLSRLAGEAEETDEP